MQKLESLVFPENGYRFTSDHSLRQKQHDIDALNQISYMDPTENYVPEKGAFRKSLTKTESGINESFTEM